VAFLPALAALAALAAFAAYQRDPQAAAETAFLALVATALLAAVAAVEAAPGVAANGSSTGRGAIAAVAAVLVVLAAWTLPAGPLRGASVAALLVGALAVAAGRRLTAGTGGAGPAAGAAVDTLRQVLAALPLSVPLALAVQVLVRSERLLAPELGPRLLVGLLGLPLVAAAATAFLIARAGRAPALTAAATAALLGPGFTTATVGALVALAAAEAVWRPRGSGAAARRERALGASVLGAAVLGTAVLGVGAVGPWAAAVVALAALLLAGRAIATGAVVLAAAAGAMALPAGAGGGDLAGAATTVAPLALVVALAVASRGARRWALAAGAAAVLAVVAVRTGLPLVAAPLAAVPLLAGRSLADRAADERHALFAPQVVWSAALLAATALASAYPWLRPRPLAAALGLFGLGGEWAASALVAAVGAAAAVVGWTAAGGPRRVASPSAAAALAAAALVVAFVAALPSPRSRVSIAEPRSLDAENPRLEIELPTGPPAAGELVVVADTSLSHAVAVPAATPVATMYLIGESVPGAAAEAPLLPPAGAWTLAAGRDTAEWSIRRPEVAALAAHAAPEPWLARVAADRFFGLAFRSHVVLPAPRGSRRLVIERHPALPPETVVHLHRLEVRR
jgi:hypothetical protein